MTSSNGRPDRSGNLSPQTVARLERRSELFVQMTQGKAKPMTYGAKAKPEKP